ncbi:MAG TPA: response regulator [Ramlibacter sp.]|uniref:response regulator n=1 Tax=Ramlibacter sp. TaxID=1917967 RepID=UPI002ED39CE9
MSTEAAGLRFLVVEDHAFQRRILAQMLLRLEAAAVTEAEDGEAALAALRDAAGAIDIVVTDLMMPGIDGMELMRRSAENGEGMAFILTSALDAQEREAVAAQALACGVRLLGDIAKPPTPAKLAPLLARYRISGSPPAAPCA